MYIWKLVIQRPTIWILTSTNVPLKTDMNIIFFSKVNFGVWPNPLHIKITKAIADICVILVWTLFSLPFGLVCLKLSACWWMRSNGIYLFVIQRLIELKTEKHKTFFIQCPLLKRDPFKLLLSQWCLVQHFFIRIVYRINKHKCQLQQQ